MQPQQVPSQIFGCSVCDVTRATHKRPKLSSRWVNVILHRAAPREISECIIWIGFSRLQNYTSIRRRRVCGQTPAKSKDEAERYKLATSELELQSRVRVDNNNSVSLSLCQQTLGVDMECETQAASGAQKGEKKVMSWRLMIIPLLDNLFPLRHFLQLPANEIQVWFDIFLRSEVEIKFSTTQIVAPSYNLFISWSWRGDNLSSSRICHPPLGVLFLLLSISGAHAPHQPPPRRAPAGKTWFKLDPFCLSPLFVALFLFLLCRGCT